MCNECRAACTLHDTQYTYNNLCNLSQAQCKLPDDGPSGPKHVGANKIYFNVNFNILYVQ